MQVDSYQETVERWKRRAGALSKQCTDLSTVMRKYITGTNKSLTNSQYSLRVFICWKNKQSNFNFLRFKDKRARQGCSCSHHTFCWSPGLSHFQKKKKTFFLPVLSFSPISPYQVFLEFLSKKNVNAGDDP